MTWRFRALLQLGVLLLSGACSLAAQSRMPRDLAPGVLLVAPRDASDPLFAKSVILLVRYDEKGALGLMVNHRTTMPISRALSGVKGAAQISEPVFVGGPVDMGTVLALARAPNKPEGATSVLGNISFIETKVALEKALGKASNPGELRIYLGYCGWGPQQLENEVREGRWYIFESSEALAFDTKPETLWSRLIARTERRFARLGFAGHPALAANAERNHR